MDGNSKGETVLSKDAVFKGTIESKDSVRIEGHLTGEVTSEGTITVGSTGKVDGDLKGRHISTAGLIKGSIQASEKVELKGTSRLEGDLVTVRLVIEDGARFEGMCNMGGKPEGGSPADSGTKATQPAATPASDSPKSGLFGADSKKG